MKQSQSFFDLYNLDTFEDYKLVISRMSLNVNSSEVAHTEVWGACSDQDIIEATLCLSCAHPVSGAGLWTVPSPEMLALTVWPRAVPARNSMQLLCSPS